MVRSHRCTLRNGPNYPRQLTHVLPVTRPIVQQQRREHYPRRARNRTLHLPCVALSRALGRVLVGHQARA
jgi:hypothetical protein